MQKSVKEELVYTHLDFFLLSRLFKIFTQRKMQIKIIMNTLYVVGKDHITHCRLFLQLKHILTDPMSFSHYLLYTINIELCT